MTTMKKTLGALGIFLMFSGLAQAQVTAEQAWIRATVPGQKSTGAFMTLRSAADAKLLSAQSDVAASTEVHEMKMDGDVMRMREVESVALPAGQNVELKPGGYHIMLMNVKQQMKAGDKVPLTLVIESADGKRQSQVVEAEVRPLTAPSH